MQNLVNLDFSQIIGVLFTLVAIYYSLFGGGSKKQSGGQESEPEEAHRAKKRLEDFLSSLDEEEKKVSLPKPPPTPKKIIVDKKPLLKKETYAAKEAKETAVNKGLQDQREQKFSGSSVVSQHYRDLSEANPYEVIAERKNSKGRELFKSLKTKKEMIILNEILMGPLSRRAPR